MAGKDPTGSSIWSIDISSSGDRVVVGSGYPEISIALLHGKGRKEYEIPSGGVPGILKFTKARGSIIAGLVARRGIGTIMNLNHRGKNVWQVNTQKKIENIEVSADGELVLCGTKDGTVLCLDKQGKNVWHRTVGIYKGPLNVQFFKDKIFTITSKGNVYIFDRLGNLLHERPLSVFVNKLGVSQHGHLCISFQNSKTFHLFDETGKVMFAKDVGDKITAMAISPTGKLILVGTIHGAVYMFQDNGKPVFAQMLSSRVNGLAISGNEKYFTVATNDFFAYLFNAKGDLYWTYRTGIGDTDVFFSEFPPDCAALDKDELKENLETGHDKEGALLLDGVRKVIRQMDSLGAGDDLDDTPVSKKKDKPGLVEEEDGFADEVGDVAVKPSKRFKPASEKRKGIVIRSWTSFKDLKQPLYMVMIKNFTQNPLEAVEIAPKVSTHTFKVIPDFKDFDTIPPNRKLLIKFKLEPVGDFRQFEDTQIFSQINYIDNFTSKMISINTNKVLVPFTIPQISFKDQEMPQEMDLADYESVQAKQDFDLTLKEASCELEDFLKRHKITFTRKEDETGYILLGKDYRGGKLYVDLSLSQQDGRSRVVTDIRYQNQKSLPPLYYFLVNRLNEILGVDEEEFTELEDGEMEWMDEEEDVEWSEEVGSDAVPAEQSNTDTVVPDNWEEGDAASVVNIRHILEKHGLERDLHYRGFYLIDAQDRTRVFDLINNNADQLEKCVLLTREYPQKIREVHIYDPELLDIRWISAMGQEGAYAPQDLDKMVSDIKGELEQNHHSMVVIDSFEYLLNNNDYSKVYNFISELKDVASVQESILVVNLDFGSLTKTQFNQLKKEADEAWEL